MFAPSVFPAAGRADSSGRDLMPEAARYDGMVGALAPIGRLVGDGLSPMRDGLEGPSPSRPMRGG